MVRNIHRLQRGVWFVGATLCLALAGCGADEQSVGGPNKPEQHNEAMSAGQISGVLAAINQGEITQAQGALERIDDPVVKAYAEKLLIEHRAAAGDLDKLDLKLGTKQEASALKTEVEQFADQVNQTITEEQAASRVAPTFLDGQMRMHKKAIGAVDKMLAQTQQPELRMYLETYRGSLQQHLEQAQQLRKRFPEMESSSR